MTKLNNFKISGIIAVFLGALSLPGTFAQGRTEEQTGISVPAVEYTAEGFRDPFQTYEKAKKDLAVKQAAPKPPPPLNIQGMVWGSDIPQAIINGKVLKVGDTVDGVKITNIDKEGVEVFYVGQTYFISSPASGGQTTGR